MLRRLIAMKGRALLTDRVGDLPGASFEVAA